MSGLQTQTPVAATPVTAEPVLLLRRGTYIRVDMPSFPGLELLTTTSHWSMHDQHGLCVQRQLMPLFRRARDNGQPVLRFGAGLEPLVLRMLADAGIRVLLGDWRQDINGEAVEPWPAWVQPECWQGPLDLPWLQLIQKHERGIARYDPGRVSPAQLIAQVALAWPSKHIAVTVTRIDDARRLGTQLRNHLNDVALVSSRHHLSRRPRVVVGTYTALGGSQAGLEWADILIAVSAVEIGGEQGQTAFRHARRARCYGLLHVGMELSPLEADQIVCMFGFHEIILPRPGHQLRRVEVSWRSINGGPHLPMPLGLLELKRRGLWHHHVRNRQIAKVGRQLLEERRPLVDGVKGWVVVLVENREHAEALAKHLPGWPVLDGVKADHALLQRSKAEPTNSPAEAVENVSGAIVTFEAMPKVELSTIDAVVRADGGTGMPPWSMDQMSVPNDRSVTPLRLVDFKDRHHPVLRRRSRSRQENYECHDWFPAGVDVYEGRMQHFLDSRPQR